MDDYKTYPKGRAVTGTLILLSIVFFISTLYILMALPQNLSPAEQITATTVSLHPALLLVVALTLWLILPGVLRYAFLLLLEATTVQVCWQLPHVDPIAPETDFSRGEVWAIDLVPPLISVLIAVILIVVKADVMGPSAAFGAALAMAFYPQRLHRGIWMLRFAPDMRFRESACSTLMASLPASPDSVPESESAAS